MDRERIEADVREAMRPDWTGFKRREQVAVLGAHCEQLLAALAEAEAEIARLRRDAEMGPTPHKCLNSDCKTISYGTGYASCPGCGGTEGMESLASRPGEGAA